MEHKNQGRRIIELCQELHCDTVTLAYVAKFVMQERGLLVDDPAWGEIIDWIEANKDVLSEEIHNLEN